MTTQELEKKYDLHLSCYDEHDSEYWSWKAEHRLRSNKFWVKVSSEPALPLDFIELYKFKLQWDVLDYTGFGENLTFARKYAEYIDWWRYSEYFIPFQSETIIREFLDFIPFQKERFAWHEPSLNFVRELRDKVTWFDTNSVIVNATNHALKKTEICDEFATEILIMSNFKDNYNNLYENVKFSKKLYDRFKRPYHLQTLIFHDCLSPEALDEVIENHKDDANTNIIDQIINRTTMGEELIEKYAWLWEREGLWKSISYHQQLSEQFIDNYKDKLSWKNLCETQRMSEKFIEEHLFYTKMWMDTLVETHTLSEQFLDKYFGMINPVFVARCDNLSEKFIEKHFKNDEYLTKVARNWKYDVAD